MSLFNFLQKKQKSDENYNKFEIETPCYSEEKVTETTYYKPNTSKEYNKEYNDESSDNYVQDDVFNEEEEEEEKFYEDDELIDTGYANLGSEFKHDIYDSDFYYREKFVNYFNVNEKFLKEVDVDSIEFRCTYISVLGFADDYNGLIQDYLNNFKNYIHYEFLINNLLLRIDVKEQLNLIYTLSGVLNLETSLEIKEEYNKLLDLFEELKVEITKEECEFESTDEEFDKKTHYIRIASDIVKSFFLFVNKKCSYGDIEISEIDRKAYELIKELYNLGEKCTNS
ncbi:hypothetical protein [Clostridium perfringens]|uniref:hypothetical protein n=1 Tax=Clostridium perfringens TaxID=1502 RepID=UPI0039E7D2B7